MLFYHFTVHEFVTVNGYFSGNLELWSWLTVYRYVSSVCTCILLNVDWAFLGMFMVWFYDCRDCLCIDVKFSFVSYFLCL